MIVPFPSKLHPKPLFMMIWWRGFSPLQNSRGDKAPPWYMPHLMLTWAIGLELASRGVFNNSKFSSWWRLLVLFLILYSSKHSSIHPCVLFSHWLFCCLSRQCTAWSLATGVLTPLVSWPTPFWALFMYWSTCLASRTGSSKLLRGWFLVGIGWNFVLGVLQDCPTFSWSYLLAAGSPELPGVHGVQLASLASKCGLCQRAVQLFSLETLSLWSSHIHLNWWGSLMGAAQYLRCS